MTRRSQWAFKIVGALSALCAIAPTELCAFCPLDTRWPTGNVTLSYSFPISGRLINNTNSWESNAESVMQEWSSVLNQARVVSGGFSGAGQNATDGINNMLFDDNVNGEDFGQDILAITLTRVNSSGFTIETDIIFNNRVDWNAYDGPIRVGPTGKALYDFRRVALHEMGHVLGLDHPDEACNQQVAAVMNARTSDTFRLSPDDRNGLSFVYADGNRAPSADAGSDQIASSAVPFFLNGGGSTDPDGAVVTYTWRIAGQVVADGRFTEVFLDVGSYVVELTVTDDDGAVDTDTVTLTSTFGPVPTDPNNVAPVANAGADFNIRVGEIILLSAADSTDPDGNLVRFLWTEGDTIIGRDPVIQYAPTIGQHLITLTVFDDSGAFSSDDVIITGLNQSADPISSPDDSQFQPPNPTNTPSLCGAMGFVPLVALILVAFVALVGRLIRQS